MGHKQGQSRHQATLFPETLDELIPPDHPVRVVDAFVESLDLGALGFDKVQAAATGRPPYHPGDMLKLYVYGYINQVRSSRRLEREAGRNLELLWLLNRLCPDFKTIANFRKDNREAVVRVCRAFVGFCRGEGLLGGELVAIDGSKFGAVASKKAVVTAAGVGRALQRVDQQIATYLSTLDESDGAEEETGMPTLDKVRTASALAALEARRAALQAEAAAFEASGARQRVETEADARLMRRSDGSRGVSYNVQTAVDSQHKLIVGHAVTNDGNDQSQLYPMARAAQRALGGGPLTAVADVGYENGAQGAACEAAGIVAVVPRQQVVNPKGAYFSRGQFRYEAGQDAYRCPAGEVLRVYRTDRRRQVRYYRSVACQGCRLKAQCTGSAWRTIVRSDYEAQVARMHQRAVSQPALMRQRACLSEHPFGTLKRMMDNGQFLMRGLDNVRAEMSLSVLGYNLKRVINILGVERLCARLRAKTGLMPAVVC